MKKKNKTKQKATAAIDACADKAEWCCSGPAYRVSALPGPVLAFYPSLAFAPAVL